MLGAAAPAAPLAEATVTPQPASLGGLAWIEGEHREKSKFKLD